MYDLHETMDQNPTVTVQVQRLPGNDDLPLPQYQSARAAGLDLRAAGPPDDPTILAPGGMAQVACGFAMALPVGYEAQVRPRSGLAANHGLTLINSPGTIDADYRGEVKVLLINHGSETVPITRGMRIAQMVIKPVPRTVWAEVNDLDATTRGEGGFGHTGK